MRRLELGDRLEKIIENEMPVFAIIEHKLYGKFHIRKGIICCTAITGTGEEVVNFKELESGMGDEWNLPVDKCFIDNDPSPQEEKK